MLLTGDFSSARFLLAEGPTLKLLHQQSLQENAEQEQRGWMSISRSQSRELWQGKPRWGEKRPRDQQPVQPFVEYVIIKAPRYKCNLKSCWKWLFNCRTPNFHNHPSQSDTREQSLMLVAAAYCRSEGRGLTMVLLKQRTNPLQHQGRATTQPRRRREKFCIPGEEGNATGQVLEKLKGLSSGGWCFLLP